MWIWDGIRRLAARYDTIRYPGLRYVWEDELLIFVHMKYSLFLQERVMIHKRPSVSMPLPALNPY